MHLKGIYPPVNVLPSLSRFKDKGIGEDKTREDHANVMNQLFASYARGKASKELATILGEAALSDEDKKYVEFSDKFEEIFVQQGEDENRNIEKSLTIGWETLAILPLNELKRIKEEYIEKYLKVITNNKES